MNTERSRRSRLSPRAYAMNLLARREYSQAELRRKLHERFGDIESDDALALLAEQNLQSDERFAHAFTRERMLRGHGPQRIERDLEQRGVAGPLIEEALRAVPEEEGASWVAQARKVLYKRFPAAQPDSGDGAETAATPTERARWMRFLAYRGFARQISAVLRDD